MAVRGDVWKVMKSGSHWAGGAGRQAASGPVKAQSGLWWAEAHGGQSWVRCDWAVGAAVDEGGGCLQGVAGVEGEDGGYVAVVVGEAAAGGWHGGGDFRPAWGSAHRQVVHGGAHSPGSPGCRSSHPLPWSRLLRLCLPSEARDDAPGGARHGGPVGGQRGEGPGLGEAQEKSGGGPGLGVGPVAPQAVWAWPCGPQGSR